MKKEKEKYMPIISYSELAKNYPYCPKSVPFSLLDEKQAQINHSQTLDTLAERGGLSPTEMIAIIAKSRHMPSQKVEHAIQSINTHIEIQKAHIEFKITTFNR